MRVAVLLLATQAGALFAQTAQTARPIIAVAGISHESDSFNPAKTGLADFGWPASAKPANFFRDNESASTTLSGYIEGAKRYGLELRPTVVVTATPKGSVSGQAFETMMNEMLRQLKALPHIDGVLLALHGAMVVETLPHGDVELTRRVRELAGPNMPIVITHDFRRSGLGVQIVINDGLYAISRVVVRCFRDFGKEM